MSDRRLHSPDPDTQFDAGPPVTVRELIDRYGEFYEENGRLLLTHRGVVRVARQVRRARRAGKLVLPRHSANQPPPTVA